MNFVFGGVVAFIEVSIGFILGFILGAIMSEK